jgi:ADP-heptose:LPS heptosyltransferase
LGELCRAEGLALLAIGGAADAQFNQHSLNQAGVTAVDLSGQTSLLHSAEIIRRARLSVGAETGMAHLAAALGKPHVVILGGGHFGRFMPTSPYTTAVCLPLECYACGWGCRYQEPYCIRAINPQAVAIAVRETLNRTSFERPRIVAQDASTWKAPPGGPASAWFPQLLDAADQIEILTLSNG